MIAALAVYRFGSSLRPHGSRTATEGNPCALNRRDGALLLIPLRYRINSVNFCVCGRGEADDGEKMLQAFAAVVKGQCCYLLLLSCLVMSSPPGILMFGPLMSKDYTPGTTVHQLHHPEQNSRGNYNRHGISYLMSSNAEGTGTQIVMVPLNEETARFTRRTSAAKTWK